MTPEEWLRQQIESAKRRHDAEVRRIDRKWRLAVVVIVIVVAAPLLFEVIRAWMK